MASNSRIKGITIELDGETTALQKALSDVTSKSIDLQGELRDVERLLKFDPGNAEALAQKQELLTKQIENTTEKLNRLRAAQEEVEQQFNNGEIGEKQYRNFRREIEYTETSLKNLNNKLSDIDVSEVSKADKKFDELKDSAEDATEGISQVGSELLGLAAGISVVNSVGEAIDKALDTSSLETKIDVSFNVPDSSVSSVRNAINTVTAYGTDAEEALEGVRMQWVLNADATDEANTQTIKYAASISNLYSDIDFTELIQETNEISKSIGITNDEALGLVNSLLKVGFPTSQLDIISEYGSQLARAGYTAEEIQGIFAAGVETGSWNIDILLDGLKEGRIVMAEFGQEIDSATAELFENIGVSEQQLQSWGQAVAEGGEAGKIAMQSVAQALAECEDKTLQNTLGTEVFGTLWEENGTKILDTILNMNNNMTTMSENQETLNNTLGGMDSTPAVQLQHAMNALQEAFKPVLSLIAEIIGSIAKWVAENSTLVSIILTVTTVITGLIAILVTASGTILAVKTAATALGVAIGAISSPILIVIGVITSLITIGVALYNNWDIIKTKCVEIWSSISNFFTATWNNISSFFTETWNNIYNVFSSITNTIVNLVVNNFENMRAAISNTFNNVISVIQNIWGNVVNFLNSINLFDIGRNIIQGLINGITNMAKSVVNSVKNVVSGAINSAKSLLGINSPSKLFTQFGEWTGEGFVNGINSMQKAVSEAGQGLADSAIPEINVANLPKVSTENKGINQTVNIYSPTALSPSETARQNKRVLQEMALQL